LKIIDRAKDVGKLADGTLFAPKYIENKLKFFPYIKERCARPRARQGLRLCQLRHGGRGQLAEKRNLPIRVTPTSPRSQRSTTWCANAWKR